MLNRMLTIEIARVTEAAAIAAATMRGRGNEKQADQLAVDAMRTALNDIEMDGKVVIGEGERDEAPMLYIGEKVGTGNRPEDRHRAGSAGRYHAVRQGHAGFTGRDRNGGRRQPAACARQLYEQNRHRAWLSRTAS